MIRVETRRHEKLVLKLRKKRLSLLVALGAVLVVSLLLATNAVNFGLPFLNDEPSEVRTKNKSLEKDDDKYS